MALWTQFFFLNCDDQKKIRANNVQKKKCWNIFILYSNTNILATRWNIARSPRPRSSLEEWANEIALGILLADDEESNIDPCARPATARPMCIWLSGWRWPIADVHDPHQPQPRHRTPCICLISSVFPSAEFFGSGKQLCRFQFNLIHFCVSFWRQWNCLLINGLDGGALWWLQRQSCEEH